MSTVVITPITQERLVAVYGEEKGFKLITKYNRKLKNAAQRKIQVSFGMEDVKLFADAWLGNGFCDYTGEALSNDPDNPMKASLERIDDTRGYVRGNLCIVGKMVNMLKDALWDKEKKTTIPAENMKLVKLLISNISEERLEELKKKYNPHYHKELFMQPKVSGTITAEDAFEEMKNELPTVTLEEPLFKATPEFELPLDVQIAAGYAEMCKFLHKAGREVTITFSQFKAAHQAKKCVITGKDLDDNRIPLLLDPNGTVATGNVKFVEPVAGNKMNELMFATGMSMYDLAKQLRKLAV